MKKFKLILSLLAITLVTSTPSFAKLTSVEKQEIGSTNLLSNGGFENGRAGWKCFKSAATARPADGMTFGSGQAITLSTTTVAANVLSGSASGVLTKPASNVQGEGCYVDFTLENGDLTSVLQIKSLTSVISGTFTAGSNGTSPTDSDLIFYIYDRDANKVIESSSFKIFSTTKDSFNSSFQTGPTNKNLRLIAYFATTSTQAFVLALDSISVEKSKYVYGTPITDWQSYTPSISSSSGTITNATTTGFWRRVGDSGEYQVRLTFNGAAGTWVAPRFGIPAGQSVDTSKLTAPSALNTAQLNDTSVASYPAVVQYAGSNLVELVNFSTNVHTGSVPAQGSSVSSTSPFAPGSGDIFMTSFELPIVGWSSSVQLSDSADTRVLVARYTTSSTAAIANSAAVFDFSNKSIDTHGAVTTGASWKFTAPTYGYYRVNAVIPVTGGSAAARFDTTLRKNGSVYKSSFVTQPVTVSTIVTGGIHEIVELNAGEYIDLTFYETIDGGTFSNVQSVSVERISGPSSIAAVESVGAFYKSSLGTALTSGTYTLLPYGQKVDDSHGAMNMATGEYTVPAAGRYSITGGVTIAAAAWTTGVVGDLGIAVYIDGSPFASTGKTIDAALSAIQVLPPISLMSVPLIAGQKVTLRVYQNSGSSRNLSAIGSQNYFSIIRTGL